MGINIAMFNGDGANVYRHEFGHIIQVQTQGWANFQARGIWEQIFVYMIKGIDPYTTQKNGQQYNEYDAEQKVNEFTTNP